MKIIGLTGDNREAVYKLSRELVKVGVKHIAPIIDGEAQVLTKCDRVGLTMKLDNSDYDGNKLFAKPVGGGKHVIIVTEEQAVELKSLFGSQFYHFIVPGDKNMLLEEIEEHYGELISMLGEILENINKEKELQ